MTSARRKGRTMAKAKSGNDWLADEIKGGLFLRRGILVEFSRHSQNEVQFCEGSRLMLGGKNGMNENIFGKSLG
jgi:hypothetical protein